VAARLVDEGLRMDEHPSVAFREGPIGRRATLVGGPDVWEVIRAVKSAHSTEPDLPENELLALVADNSGLSVRVVPHRGGVLGDAPRRGGGAARV
jgi:hypothetical protein